ncbi:MoaF-related domain-containing protein [Sphingobacterium gobiense]|uniref:MoaF-like domain-containing protein n=1 Tax=Sphingobacterium gobiense TaxID=1382456 RepID=A0A2S9JNE1_9SPHI|nr:MoaF N-terminal domain-containing protein [Sphingobacterium gobiense]PRD54663.1 hypothetical protein C5749_14600 [Sphingobacterium gobiense]
MKTQLLIVSTVIIALGACAGKTNKVDATSEVNDSVDYQLIGKKARLTYPTLSAEVTYIDDSTLHWSQTDTENNHTEGTETISYKQLNNHQFFLSWIEADGYTVSQVIDLETKKVTAYLSYHDEKSKRGKRAADFVEGTVEIIE